MNNPAPKEGIEVPTWTLVIADMMARDRLGTDRYGTPHQADNGRNHLLDLYEELLDAACYIRAELQKQGFKGLK